MVEAVQSVDAWVTQEDRSFVKEPITNGYFKEQSAGEPEPAVLATTSTLYLQELASL